MNAIAHTLDALVRRNIARADAEIQRSLALAEVGVPLAAEPEAERAAGRIERKASLGGSQAETIARSIQLAGLTAMQNSAAMKAAGAGEALPPPVTACPRKCGATPSILSMSASLRAERLPRARWRALRRPMAPP